MPRITMACPAANVADANQLAACLGFSMADAETYGPPNWQAAGGARYSCASLDVSEDWLTQAQQPLVRPAWDVDEQIDMVAAARAQATVVLLTEPAPATLTALTALVWPDGPAALAAMGLVVVEGAD
jgi:hypothetical protein